MRELPLRLPRDIAAGIASTGLEDGKNGHMARKGWRYWFWTPAGISSGFRGHREGPWEPLVSRRAVCLLPLRGTGSHRAPDERHRCGIRATVGLYALRSWNLPSRANTVVGEVILWGRVIQRNKVLYGELAYPMSLYLIPETFAADDLGIAEEALNDYGVPIGHMPAVDAAPRGHGRLVREIRESR